MANDIVIDCDIGAGTRSYGDIAAAAGIDRAKTECAAAYYYVAAACNDGAYAKGGIADIDRFAGADNRAAGHQIT